MQSMKLQFARRTCVALRISRPVGPTGSTMQNLGGPTTSKFYNSIVLRTYEDLASHGVTVSRSRHPAVARLLRDALRRASRDDVR